MLIFQAEEIIRTCQNPCPPEENCPACYGYWHQMRELGYWIDGEGWTEKALREMMK